jgi:hypothetical protein
VHVRGSAVCCSFRFPHQSLLGTLGRFRAVRGWACGCGCRWCGGAVRVHVEKGSAESGVHRATDHRPQRQTQGTLKGCCQRRLGGWTGSENPRRTRTSRTALSELRPQDILNLQLKTSIPHPTCSLDSTPTPTLSPNPVIPSSHGRHRHQRRLPVASTEKKSRLPARHISCAHDWTYPRVRSCQLPGVEVRSNSPC